MSTPNSTLPDLPDGPEIREQDLQARERFEDELIMHLERDQFVAETSRPVPRARLGVGAAATLWALRVFVVLVSIVSTFGEDLDPMLYYAVLAAALIIAIAAVIELGLRPGTAGLNRYGPDPLAKIRGDQRQAGGSRDTSS